MSQQIGGLTRQQIEFFNSKPWGGPREGWPFGGWVGKSPKNEPYISGSMVEAILTAGFGPGGWSMEVLDSDHQMLSPFAGKDRSGNAITIYTVLATAKVRIVGYARNADGFLMPGVEACHFDGADAHASTCHSQGGVGSIVGNAIKGAITRAMRSAASRLGPVTGRDVMRGRDDGRGKKYPVENFVSEVRPTLPEFPCMGDAAGVGGFDAKRVLDDAAAGGGSDYDYDNDGEAYDPHTGVVQPAQQQRSAPVQPAQQSARPAPAHQTAPKPASVPPVQQQSAPAPAPTAEAPRPAYSARPHWMSEADFARIQNNDRIVRDDDKPWTVLWNGPDGNPVSLFCADPGSKIPTVIKNLAMPDAVAAAITVRLREPGEQLVGDVRGWDAASVAQRPAPARQPASSLPDRVTMLKAIREHAQGAHANGQIDAFVAIINEFGVPEMAALRGADENTVGRIYAAIFGGAK